MLELHHLRKYFAGVKAVDDISFAVQPGSIFGLLGPNGAGKSTILRMITGITIPDEGQILLHGQSFTGLKQQALIGYMPEERGLYKKMKIGEQALYLAQLKGLSKQEAIKRLEFWFNRLEMGSWWHKKVEDLSKGMSQKLQFVTTVVHQPKLLILDEPFSGLDPVNSETIKQEIYRLAKEGTTIIFSTHRMEQVEEICDDIALINQGHVVLNGNLQNIKQQYKENAYRLVIQGELNEYGGQATCIAPGEYRLHLQGEEDVKQLLQFCIDRNIPIRAFNEILPGLNDIFIRLVQQGAVRKFNEPQ